MQTLSADAMFVLERMDLDRHYDAPDLRRLLPLAGAERVREIMHELWLDRQVERAGPSGWRRQRSAPPYDARSASSPVEPVTADDLFDHAPFADLFK